MPHISSQLEKKLYSIFKESGDLDFPEEDWVFQVLPELNDLEADTLDTLMAQAQAHAKYERAARELVLHERAKLDAEHAQEIRSLRAQFESESTRTSVSSEMRLKQLGTKAAEEQEELRKEAQEKIAELEEVIEQLEAQVEAKDKELREVAEEAEEEVERLKDEKFAAAEKLRAAEEETDLKREASRKLKEEIIDNDRLTVANLNRIKQLEATVEQHKEALKEVEHENEDLRAELEKAAALGEAASEAEEEVASLRELLNERESQLVALSRRMTDVLEERDAMSPPAGARRDSFFNRLPFAPKNSPSLLASNAA